MQVQDIHTIAIAGAGTMGAGIAQVCAQAGYTTILYDLNAAMLEKAKAATDKNLQFLVDKEKLTAAQKQEVIARISYTSELETVKADLIIEAIIEKLDIKRDLFTCLVNAEWSHKPYWPPIRHLYR